MCDIVDGIYENERWPSSYTNMPDLSFLWQRDNYVEDIEQYAKYVYEKEKDSYGLRDNIFCKLFPDEETKSEPKELTAKKHTFIKHSLLNNVEDIKYSCFIFNVANYMSEHFRRELLGLFLLQNTSFDDFQVLDYELTTRSWSGSRVPILEKEKNYLVSMLPMLNRIELLEHRAYVEKQIEYKVKSIEEEKKRDFLESRY